MQDVIISVHSTNAQVKKFADLSLGSFSTVDPQTGKRTRHHFIDGSRNDEGELNAVDFIIGSGGNMRLDGTNEINRHNIEKLKIMLGHQPPILPPNIIVRVEDLAQTARQQNEKRKAQMAIYARLNEASPDFIESMARLLGYGPMVGVSHDMVLDFVLNQADTNPVRVQNILDDSDRDLLFEIEKGMEAEFITFIDGQYRYNGNFVGTTREALVAFLHENPDQYGDLTLRNNRHFSRRASDRTPHRTTPPAAPLVTSVIDLDATGSGADTQAGGDAATGEVLTGAALLDKAVKAKRVFWQAKAEDGRSRGYQFGNIFLGASQEAAAEFLLNADNEVIVSLLRDALNQP